MINPLREQILLCVADLHLSMLEAFCNLHCFALFFLSQVSLSKQWFYDFEPTWVEQPDRTYHKRFGIPASGPISSVSQFQRSVVGASHSISWQLLWKSFVLISGIYNLDNYASHSTLIGTWSIWLVSWIFLSTNYMYKSQMSLISNFFKDEMLTYDAM